MRSFNPSREIFSQVLKYYILINNVLKILGGYVKPQTRQKLIRCHGNELQFIHLLYVNGSFELKFWKYPKTTLNKVKSKSWSYQFQRK